MNVNPRSTHDSQVITIHACGRDGKTEAATGRPPQADPGAWRTQLAMAVIEHRGIMAQHRNNANLRGALEAAHLRLDQREVALQDREVRILPKVRLGAAGCFTAGAVSGLGGATIFILNAHIETDVQGHAVADGMSMAGMAMLGLSLAGALGAVGAAQLSARQWAQVQTERDSLLGQEAALETEATELEARAVGLQRAEYTLVRHVTRHEVTQETGMPEVLVDLIVGYLADQDLPWPPLPAPTGA
jgi:hypothetical protein